MHSLIDSLFRPKGVTAIVFSETEQTHIRFKWARNSEVVITLNRPQFDRLSPALRYFVIMHEVGHLQKLKIHTTSFSVLDEDEADQYAYEQCLLVGYDFGSAKNARQKFNQAFN